MLRRIGIVLSCVVFLSVLWMGCSQEPGHVLGPAAGDNTGSAPPEMTALFIGPIDGLTTAWHQAPARIPVPLGTTVRLRYDAPRDAIVKWTGAVEVERTAGASIAICPLQQAGEQTVIVRQTTLGRNRLGRTAHQCVLNVIDVPVSDIRVEAVEVTGRPIDIDPNATNAETMRLYFGASIAKLRQTADGRYVTSVNRPVTIKASVEPPVFGPVAEIRVDGVGRFIGTSREYTFNDRGAHTVSVGPPASAAEVRVVTYETSITGHRDGRIAVDDGETVTFTATTRPRGFEDDIVWLSSTKYGTAVPVTGRGAQFTVRFDGTYSESGKRWIGVKADNAAAGADAAVMPVRLFQVDATLDGATRVASDWGSADVTFLSDGNVQYFNLSIDGVWRVMDLPIMSTGSFGAPQTVTVNFRIIPDAALPPFPVSTVNFGFTLTATPTGTMPPSTNVAQVQPRVVNIQSGEQGQGLVLTDAGNVPGGPANPLQSGVNIGVPNQEVGVNECVPGAISNSLKFLKKNGLNISDANTSVDSMKVATGWGPNGAPVGANPWWDRKNAYMQAKGIPVTTTTTADFPTAIQALKDGCDVELRAPGHAAVVTFITDLGNGNFGIMVKHDTDQGNDGGTKEEVIIYDGTTGKLWDGWAFDQKLFDRFVIECPQ